MKNKKIKNQRIQRIQENKIFNKKQRTQTIQKKTQIGKTNKTKKTLSDV